MGEYKYEKSEKLLKIEAEEEALFWLNA